MIDAQRYPNMSSNLPPVDARERVFAAANQIFDESARQTMPTVDQVRRLAKVDMHAATAAMREWRRQHYPDITDWSGYNHGTLPMPKGAS